MGKYVCVYDICDWSGGMWADYEPATGITYFGGEWSGVPNMITDHEPTENECWNWANEYLQNQKQEQKCMQK